MQLKPQGFYFLGVNHFFSSYLATFPSFDSSKGSGLLAPLLDKKYISNH